MVKPCTNAARSSIACLAFQIAAGRYRSDTGREVLPPAVLSALCQCHDVPFACPLDLLWRSILRLLEAEKLADGRFLPRGGCLRSGRQGVHIASIARSRTGCSGSRQQEYPGASCRPRSVPGRRCIIAFIVLPTIGHTTRAYSTFLLSAVEQRPSAAQLRHSRREERDVDRRECMPQEFPIRGSEGNYSKSGAEKRAFLAR
jgi:hypothetical protein